MKQNRFLTNVAASHILPQNGTLSKRKSKLRTDSFVELWLLNNLGRIFKRAGAGDGDLDDVARLHGEGIRRNDAGAGEQDGAIREGLAAE